MKSVDVSENHRVASLMQLMQSLEACRTPVETLEAIGRGLSETYGPVFGSLLLSTRGLAEGEYRVATLRLGKDMHGRFPDLWAADPSPVHRGGVVARIIKQREPKLLQDVDWTTDPYFGKTLAGSASLLAVPFFNTRLPMSWVINLKPKPLRFTEQELEQLILQVALVGTLLEAQVLAERLTKTNAAIDRDIRELADLQRSLLPNPLPRIPGLELATEYRPSGQAGGDWYDFFMIDDGQPDVPGTSGRWCLFIGDASGHGAAAAVVMAIVQSILRTYSHPSANPTDLLRHANTHLCRKHIGGFVTAFLAIYDPATSRLAYSTGGHPPPLLKRAGGELLELNQASTYPLGIDESEQFREAAVEFNPGDTLLLYTDGITEARGGDGSMFETKGVEEMMNAFTGTPADLVRRITDAVAAHQGNQKQADDQTLVAIQRMS